MQDIDRKLLDWNKWNILTKKIDKIYRQTTFSKLSFLTDYTIKIVERTYNLFNEYETIQLFNMDSINRHRERYAFLYVGLVQVAVKPLTIEALNACVLICLRDDRHLRFRPCLVCLFPSLKIHHLIFVTHHSSLSLKNTPISDNSVCGLFG